MRIRLTENLNNAYAVRLALGGLTGEVYPWPGAAGKNGRAVDF